MSRRRLPLVGNTTDIAALDRLGSSGPLSLLCLGVVGFLLLSALADVAVWMG